MSDDDLVECPSCDGIGCVQCDGTGWVSAALAEDIIDAMIWSSLEG